MCTNNWLFSSRVLAFLNVIGSGYNATSSYRAPQPKRSELKKIRIVLKESA